MSFWERKTVLVTGASGFLGRHVVEELRYVGCNTIYAPSHWEMNLMKSNEIGKYLRVKSPDIVIHLAAACGGIEANRLEPGRFFYQNAIMGMNLIENCREWGVEKTVVIGTICAYPKFTPIPFKEEDLWNGYPEETNAPYGLAKKMLLVQLQAYRQQYGMNGIYLLPVNLYGPWDNFNPTTSHVIPAIIRKLLIAKENLSPTGDIWGSGNASREFLYVKDCAKAIVMATELYNKQDPVNIGANFEITIKDLANKIKQLVGYQGDLVFDLSKPDGQPRRRLDISNALLEFGFVAETSLNDGLTNTIKWFLENNT